VNEKASDIKEKVVDAAYAAANAAHYVRDTAAQTAEDLLETAKEKASKAANTAKSTAYYVEDSAEVLAEKIRENMDTAKRNAKDIADTLKESIEGKARTIAEHAAAEKVELKEGLKESLYTAAKDIKQMASSVKDKAAGLKAGIESAIGLDAERAENERVQRKPSYIDHHWNLSPAEELLLKKLQLQAVESITPLELLAKLIQLKERDPSSLSSEEQALISRLARDVHGSPRKVLVEQFNIGLNEGKPVLVEEHLEVQFRNKKPLYGEDIAGFQQTKEKHEDQK